MKVLFMENRQQTLFWQAIAAKLQQDGHQIFWVVQNASFMPSVGHSQVIPYPNGNCRMTSKGVDQEIHRIISADRGVNYFGGDASHYGYYTSEIGRILESLQPDVVFGEATLFHELLCIERCRARKILYLDPASCRYPPRRFSFYLYDTQIPFQGSEEVFSERDSLAMVGRIARREVEPDYIKKRARGSAFRVKLRAFRNALKVTASYLVGEHYNTPSPVSKFLLEFRLRKNKFRWEKLASRAQTVGSKFRILYPLQMQPEGNIDLWGNAYREQTKLLAALLQAADSDAVVVVKPNPKSKYELSDDLIKLVASSERLLPVSHKLSMTDVLQTIDLIVTVTGTVAIEAIFADRPAVTLVKSLHNAVPSCVYLENLNGLGNVIRQVREGTFPKATEAEKLAFLSLLTRTSYRGIISNPYSTPICLSDENIRDVHIAFRHVLGAIRNGRADLRVRSDETDMATTECTSNN